MNEQEDFLEALAENEDDTDLRMNYADWLEEQGEYEEAERQRMWPAAKAWLVEFASEQRCDENVTYGNLLSLGYECLENDLVSFGSDEIFMYKLDTDFGTFMKNWSIVTGHPLPEGGITRPRFKCAC